jgi:endonuclease YncB( thermonuclease family)
MVVAAGRIEVGDKTIRLAGIAVTEPDRTCGDGSRTWPCGRMARTALRRFVRARAIECDIPQGADSVPDPARCYVGGDDIAAWLVAQGWAEDAGGTYGEPAQAAREMKLGLYSATRPDAQPEDVAARP